MTKILYNILLMSVSGTIMFLLASLLNRQTKNRYARWYYALIITSVAIFILPLHNLHGIFQIPKAVNIPVSETAFIHSDGGAAVSTSFDISYIIFGIWAAGALSLLVFNAYSCVRTRRTLMSLSRTAFDARILLACRSAEKQLGIKREIAVRTSDMLRSPLLFGIIKPTVILPEKHFTSSELQMIFTHELTHYKHRDIAVKLAAAVAASLHWFNPCVYLLRGAVNNGCELCCDETVLSVLNLEDKKQYGRLLLSIIEGGRGGFAYTTAMSSKQSIKQRLLKIVEFKRMSLPVKMVSVMAALSITVCSVTAFGFDVVKDKLPEKITKAFGYSTVYDAGDAYLPRVQSMAADESEKPAVNNTDTTVTETENAEETSYIEAFVPTPEPVKPVPEAEETEEVPVIILEETPQPEPPAEESAEPAEESAEPEEAYAALPETAEELSESDYFVDEAVSHVRFPDTSYMFNPSFTGTAGEKIQSSLITVTSDCYMYIKDRYAGHSVDYSFGLYNADGTLILSDKQLYYSKIPVKAGSEYYIIASSDTECSANIYVYAK